MAVEGYFYMQVGFKGEKQNFQLYQPGIRSPKARLATFFDPPATNKKTSSSQIFVVARWGDASPALNNACGTNENLREVRLDFWTESSVSPLADFSLFLSNANITNKRIYWSYDDESPKETLANRTPSPWTGFGFNFNTFEKKGLIPAHLHPLLNFPR